MRITSIFLFTIIIFGGLSCSNDDSLIHNKTKGILEKYPEPTVTITAHNHIPFLAKNILEEKAITKSVNIISDIAWANGFGRTITARSDEMVIPDNMNRYIYPGSILEASSIAETRFTPIPVKTIRSMSLSLFLLKSRRNYKRAFFIEYQTIYHGSNATK